MIYAIILSIPRVAPVRPAAAPAIIKRIINEHNLASKIIDINIDYFTSFKNSIAPALFNEIDDYLFVKNKTLSATATAEFYKFIDGWIQQITVLQTKKLFIIVFSWQAQRFVEEFF